MWCQCNVILASTLKKSRGVVAWVVFLVALVAACISLVREGEVGFNMLFFCQELFLRSLMYCLFYD